MRTLSVEWSRFGIKLCAVAAGQFDTEALRTKYPQVVVENVPAHRPARPPRTAEEMAWLIAYLASPAGDFFSGSVITIDGARDNWFGSWPPGRAIGEGGEPAGRGAQAQERRVTAALCAPDSFKGTMSAAEVAAAMAAGVRRAGLDANELPLADGGEGTLDVLVSSLGGELRTAPASDPLGRPVEASFALLDDGRACRGRGRERHHPGRAGSARRLGGLQQGNRRADRCRRPSGGS